MRVAGGNYSFIGNELRRDGGRRREAAAETVELIHRRTGGPAGLRRSADEKEDKSERRMPRLPEAKKDVVSCEKARGFANRS